MLRADGIKRLESEKERLDSGGTERASDGNKNKPYWMSRESGGEGTKKSYECRHQMSKREGSRGLDLGKSRTRGR